MNSGDWAAASGLTEAPAGRRDPYPALIRERYPFLTASPPVRLLGAVLPRYLRRGARAIDVGCGIGLGACHLAAMGAEEVEYVGLDPREDVCRTAAVVVASLPAGAVRGRIVRAGLAEYAREGRGAADLVLCLAAFHECVGPETPAAIASQLRALLSPDGLLVVGDPCLTLGAPPDEMVRLRRHAERAPVPGDSAKPYLDPAALRAAFAGAGLDPIEWHEGPLFLLGRSLGLPHARYVLTVLGAPAPAARRTAGGVREARSP